MTDEAVQWQPLNIRDTAAAADYRALAEGVPEWLEGSIWRWAMDRAAEDYHGVYYKAERVLRISLPKQGTHSNPFADYWASASHDARLTLVDFFLRNLQEHYDDAHLPGSEAVDVEQIEAIAYRLEHILTEGGSVWGVQYSPFWGLAKRVNDTTQALVDLASSPSTDAARRVTSAWSACYRHKPDYDKAYRDAVLAVEAIALPIVLPKASRGTLGTVVAHIRDTVDQWSVGELNADEQASGETLLAMLRSLWHNQERHAQPDGSIRDVTQSEAEAALPIAVMLVHWFSSGLIRRTRHR